MWTLLILFSAPCVSHADWAATKTSLEGADTFMFSDNDQASGSKKQFIDWEDMLNSPTVDAAFQSVNVAGTSGAAGYISLHEDPDNGTSVYNIVAPADIGASDKSVEIESLVTNVLEWHLNSDLLGAAATVPDEAMTFRIPNGVDYDTLTVECDGTTHTSMAIDLAYAATRYGTYTDEGAALTATFTHGSTAASPIDVSGYGSLTEGQYVNLRVSTASSGDATMCNASLKLISN